jgi:hypothetical protein
MEVSGQLHVLAANSRTETCVPIGSEAEWGPGPVPWIKKSVAGYWKINYMYAFVIHRLKNLSMP